MRNSKKKIIHKMEVEDDLGILRKKTHKVMSLKTFKIIKIVLIALLPLAYFIYSPLMLPLAICYFLLYFIALSIEKNANRNLKKEFYISIPKFDSVLSLIAVIITVAGVFLGMFTTTMKGGMFEDKTDEEIRTEMEERGLDDTQIDQMIERMQSREAGSGKTTMVIKNAFTMLSGERVFFSSTETEKDMGARPQGMMQGGSGDGEFTPPDGAINENGRGNMMELADNVPFEKIFSQVASSINTVIIFLVSLSGLLTIYIMKRIEG